MHNGWSAGLSLRFQGPGSFHLLFLPGDNIGHLRIKQKVVREYVQYVLSSEKNGANKKDPKTKTIDLPFMLPVILQPIDKFPSNFFQGHRNPGHIRVETYWVR